MMFLDGEQLSRALGRLYRSYGYRPYKISKFEEYDLYVRNKPFLQSEHVLTFHDPNGRLMALKPDATLSIVKNAESAEKVYYTENVYRVPKNDDSFREIMQTGLECIGEIDVYAMGEVLRLAAGSLSLISPRTVLDVSDLRVLSGVLADCGADEETAKAVVAAFGAKNAAALGALGLPGAAAETLRALMALGGPLGETIGAAAALPLPAESRAALEELREIAALLADSPGIRLDFSVVNDMEYYNGLCFRGFVEGVPAGVLSGGRYDNLLARMGKTGGALGFAVYLDQLERLYGREDEVDFDTLLLYGSETEPAAVCRAVERERALGKSVRAQRETPRGLSFRETIDLREGASCGR